MHNEKLSMARISGAVGDSSLPLRPCVTALDVHIFSKLSCKLDSNFRLVLNVLCFLLGNFTASEFYTPTFRNTLSHLHRQVDVSRMS